MFQWICEKQFDLHKKKAILRFFIDIFLDISEKSARFSWYRQSLFYLKQVKYLADILRQECAAFGDEVQEIMDVINREEPKIVHLYRGSRNQDIEYELPNTPVVNGNVSTIEKQVKIRPHFNFERNKLKSAQDIEVSTPETAKTSRRKTVAFNVVEETRE